jgi:raffinose/stachyose/melibiose transport system substrate-binding protein
MKKNIVPLSASITVTTAVLGSAALLLGVLTSAPASAELSKDPVTLKVQYETTAAPEEKWKAMAKEFTKKYPNVKIEFTAITNEAKGGPNLQVLSSDGAPDIGLIPLNSNVYTQLVKNKALVPLNGIFKADDTVKRIGPPADSLLQPDGNYYAAPHSVVYYNVLWTNPDAIKKAGATLPKDGLFKNVTEFINFSKKCSAAGYAGLAIGGKTNFQASWMFDAMMPSAVSDDALNNYINSYKKDVPVTASWTSSGIVKTLTALGQLAKAGVYQKGYLGMDLDQATAFFTSGKSCLLLGGTWMPGGAFEADTKAGTMKFTPSFAVLPPVVAGAKSTFTPYYGDAFGVPTKSKNREWALELLRYSVSDEGQRIGVLEASGNFPAINTVPKSAYTKIPKAVLEVLAHVEKYGVKSGWTSEVPGAYGQAFLNPLIQRLQEGKTSAVQISRDLQKELLKVRKSGL